MGVKIEKTGFIIGVYMKTIQYHIRKSYYEKLHILMENFPHNYKREFKFVDQRLIQPRLRRMNENREFAKEPLPKNLPFTQIEPKFDFNIEMTPERVDQYQKLLRYHGFLDNKGRYQHSAFLESLIFRAFEKLEKEKPEVASKKVKPLNSDFDPVAFAMGNSHDDENWVGD